MDNKIDFKKEEKEIKKLLISLKNNNNFINKIINKKNIILKLCLDKHITEEEFFSLIRFLTPQSRSPLIENYIQKKI